jgi:hypothetical protein
MKLKDFRTKLKNLVVRIVGDRIAWYYDSYKRGALRTIIERAQIGTFSGTFQLELEEDCLLYKGKNFMGAKLRFARIWKFIPERKVFGKHIILAERKEVFFGRFEKCIRHGKELTISDLVVDGRVITPGKCHVGQTIEIQCEGSTVYSISDIVFVKKEPMKIQLKSTSHS